MQDNRSAESAILIVAGLVPDKLGSYERFMAAIAERGRKKGCRVDFLLAGEPLSQIQAALARSGSTVFVLEDWEKGARWQQARRFAARYASLMRDRRYQLVSFSFCDPLVVLTALWRSALSPRRPRTIWHQHSEQRRPQGFLERRLSVLKIASWFMDGVCPVYAAATQTMRERGIANSKIFTLRNGATGCETSPQATSQKRSEIGAASGDFVLFTAASLIERKNIPMMLRAFSTALSKMPNLLLLIAGEGGLEQSLKELSCELKITGQVRWLGLRNDVAELCAAADLCLITSHAEALPFFSIEAFAANRTMIATPAGGLPEIVQDGVNGAIVAFDDSEALAREILHLAQDSDLRHSYEKAAGETYHAGYTLDQMVESYLGYYCRFLR
jgi:glycosyltransferase involved in cell wall biosynthesis